MNTFDDSLLGTRFALLAPEPLAASWDDVLGKAGAVRKSGRRRLVIAFAVVAAAAAIAASAVGAVRDFVLRTGFIGLPPIGATPSSPASGKLEIWYWAPWSANGKDGRTRAWVYADGRLISWGGPDRPGSANPLSTGYLEQRLTPEGVERLRSEIAAAGDFGDPDELTPPGKPPCPLGQSPSDRKKAIADGDCQLPTPEPAPDAPITVPFYYTDSRGGPRHARSRRPCARSQPTVRATLGPGDRGSRRARGWRETAERTWRRSTRSATAGGRPTSRSDGPASWHCCRQRSETCSETLH